MTPDVQVASENLELSHTYSELWMVNALVCTMKSFCISEFCCCPVEFTCTLFRAGPKMMFLIIPTQFGILLF